ncbi:MAG: 30S ribosomal protein S5 [Lentimicrobiaceae bacterium]|jgi:small subunit ribosomal protein S5|nr:30S ribosomal protein S5 [Lentimicrobiaceae bacterium]MBQ2906264.1 30S ribosomal protein S5 [Bacteroidales bacterium]MBE6342817.1 30S ribosomal protein S5 [Lentimicrobiaceae bacterium]MBQ3595328.1 30S ribosomal protein S5 [Bacteroidales bacterium]MBQ4549418.1 30S ribosomal protein S5 [Bacteroidales bacterium]
MSEVNVKRVKTSEIEFKERLVSVQRVTKVTKGGRTFSFSAIVVVGNENGVVGYGLGKAKEVQAAVAKGIDDAKKNLIKVPIINGTLPHEQYGKYCGAYVYVQPATPGTGVIAGGAMRAVLESVGVKNVLAKSKGSSNPHSVVKATFAALSQMRDARMVAELRGVDMDVVFNG